LNTPNQPSRFQTAEIEFGDDTASKDQNIAPVKKLYDYAGGSNEPQGKQNPYSYEMDGGVFISCRVEEWGKGFTLFGDFIRDAKKYYRKTCINANYVYFFSYRPMYKELSHEQLCWYLFWRSRVREGIYPKTGLSYIFLYLYEQINLSDVIGREKVYENIIKIWQNYRAEFPRIDKYIAEWLTDFSFIYKFKINLGDIEEILPHIVNIVTIPEIYIREDFFKDAKNTDLIMENMSVYDYKKSKFYNEKNRELFDYHIVKMLQAVLSGADFDAIILKEIENGAKVKNTRESYMGAVCVYEHKKKITVEYKNLYKNFFLRQCVTDTIRYSENALRDYLKIKSKLPVTAYPPQLKKIIEDYRGAYLSVAKPAKLTVKTKGGADIKEEIAHRPIEFNPDIKIADEIEKSSWDTTMMLVELQARDSDANVIVEETVEFDDGEFIAIDTGTDESYEALDKIAPAAKKEEKAEPDIFDILENLENSETRDNTAEDTEMGKFIASLGEDEYAALSMLVNAGKDFAETGADYMREYGGMLESAVDAINEKAMDFIGDVIFDAARGEIIEDYKKELEGHFKNDD